MICYHGYSFVGETRSLNQPDTDAEQFSYDESIDSDSAESTGSDSAETTGSDSAESTDSESPATVNPRQPVAGQAQDAQHVVGAVTPQPGSSNPLPEANEGPNPSERVQSAIPTLGPSYPVQEAGCFDCWDTAPEETEHPHQPLQDYFFVMASRPSKLVLLSYTTENSAYFY